MSRGIAAAAGGEGDLGAQPLQQGALQGVERPQVDHVEQAQGRVGRPGPQLGAGGGEGALHPACGIGGQRGGSFEEGRRRRQSAPSPGLSRRALQVAGDLLVGPERRLGAVPGAAIGTDIGVDDLGERAMRAPALVGRRRVVDRRAHQRVTEAHLCSDAEQPVGLGGGGGVAADAHPFRRTAEQHRVATGVDRRDQEQPAGLRRERLDPAQEALLDPAGQRLPGGQPEASRELGGRQAAMQLEQGERVALGLGDDAVAHSLVEPPGDHRGDEPAGVGVGQTGELQLRDPRELGGRTGVAHREEQGDRHGVEAAGHERQHLGGGLVQPVGVLDHPEQRPVLRDLLEQAEHGQPDEEAIRRGAGGETESGAERVALRAGKPVEPAQHLPAELVQPGEGELHLRLDSGGAGDSEARRGVRRVVEERGLADPRRAAHHQSAAPPRTGGGEQLVDGLALSAPAVQRGHRCGPRG
ncbi:MAG: hypothetical protein JWM18_2010 [Chloroflexi bacterium]|nr:hypothetical protein [Chloroflexota bacterium]